MLLLAACGGGTLDSNQAPSTTVSLATAADALRELGNTAYAVGLLQLSLSSMCSSGTYTVATGSTTRSFAYFTGVTEAVSFAVNDYSGCVESGNPTLTGVAEAGATDDGSYSFVVRGSYSTAAPLQVQSSGTNGSGAAVNIARSELGTVETHVISATQSEIRSGLQTSIVQTPQGGGAADDGNFSVGVNGPTFDVMVDSSGDGSETIAGAYSYSSSVCSGGIVTAATPSALLLTPSTGGTLYASGGVLTLSSGANTVTYTFNSSGATLSGSISGSLSSTQVEQAFATGSGC